MSKIYAPPRNNWKAEGAAIIRPTSDPRSSLNKTQVTACNLHAGHRTATSLLEYRRWKTFEPLFTRVASSVGYDVAYQILLLLSTKNKFVEGRWYRIETRYCKSWTDHCSQWVLNPTVKRERPKGIREYWDAYTRRTTIVGAISGSIAMFALDNRYLTTTD